MQRVHDFLAGFFFCKILNVDVADAGLDIVGEVDAGARNFCSNQMKHHGLGLAFTGDGDVDRCAFRALQHVGDVKCGRLLDGFTVRAGTVDRLAVHGQDHIAGRIPALYDGVPSKGLTTTILSFCCMISMPMP